MRWGLPALALLAALPAALPAAPATAGSGPGRPGITGISHLAVYTSDPAAADPYYREVIGAARLPDPEDPRGVRYALSATQSVEVLPLPAGAGINRLDHSAWNVTSAEQMRRYLAAKGWRTPAKVTTGSDRSRWFEVTDPEGNRVQFVEPAAGARVDAPDALGHRIIHIGFMVHDRAAEDRFYRDLLGFRPYWFGGMHYPDRIDWVSQQAPDGHDWLEYMLAGGGGTGIPASMTQHQLGVLDHLSIGQLSVFDTCRRLRSGGRLVHVVTDDQAKIGKDGKGQFNLYDPDGIRLELMNFHATEKPCCSPFTAADPAAE